MLDLSVYYMYLQYFDTVGWVFWPVKTRLPYYSLPLLYCVGSWRGRKTLLNPILTCGIVFLVVNYSIYIQFCSVYTIAVGVFFIVSSCASCAPYNCSQMWVDKYAKTVVIDDFKMLQKFEGYQPSAIFFSAGTPILRSETVRFCCGTKKLLFKWWCHHVLLQSAHADVKPSYTYDNVHCYAIQITAS